MMNFRGRRGEVPVGDVDRDALLAFGPEAVGEEREVRVVEAAFATRPLDGFELVLEDLLAVEEQPTDQGALAVVDRSGSGEAKEFHQNGRFRCGARVRPGASVVCSWARLRCTIQK